MRLRRDKPQLPPRGGDSRERRRPAATPERRATTFSYYANRPQQSSMPPSRQPVRRRLPDWNGAVHLPVRPRLKALPFVVLCIIVLVCAAKLLYVSNTPKVVVRAGSAAANNALRPSSDYARVAEQALRGSLVNHLKPTVDTTGAAQAVEAAFPELQSAAVSVPLVGNRPVLYVVPAQPQLLLRTGSSSFAVTADGLAFTAPASGIKDVPVVTDQTGATLSAGHQALPAGTVAFIATVAYQLKHGGQTVTSFTLPARSAYELDAQLAGKPFTIRFNLQADARQQSGALLATLQHLGSTTPSQYIDMRVPERVYYK